MLTQQQHRRAPPPVRYRPQVYAERGTGAGRIAGWPRGIILHGSRGGARSRVAEFDATRRYAATNGVLGWHVTIGEDVLSVHLAPSEWGWNARAASPRYLAVELAQPSVHWAITDAQVRALAWWIVEAANVSWPGLGALPTHAELEARGETGARDGKTDVFPVGDPRADELRARLAARLADPTWR